MIEEENKEVSRTMVITMNIYLLCMLLLDYLDELGFKFIPVWARRVKSTGNKFKEALEQKIIENEINRIHGQAPDDFRYMIKRFDKLTRLIVTYDPQELEDFIDLADSYKNDKERFLEYFNIVRDEQSTRKDS